MESLGTLSGGDSRFTSCMFRYVAGVLSRAMLGVVHGASFVGPERMPHIVAHFRCQAMGGEDAR